MEKIGFKIQGMISADCAYKIEQALKQIKGVSYVTVNLALKKVSVEYDPILVDIEQLDSKISSLGYTLVANRVNLKIRGMKCATCASRIEKELKALPGVSRVVVNLLAEKAIVVYFGSQITIKDFADVIRNLGYEVVAIDNKVSLHQEKGVKEWDLAEQKPFLCCFALPFF